jgi:hypothetical protein
VAVYAVSTFRYSVCDEKPISWAELFGLPMKIQEMAPVGLLTAREIEHGATRRLRHLTGTLPLPGCFRLTAPVIHLQFNLEYRSTDHY